MINECHKPTRGGTTTFHLTIEWLSHSPLWHIPNMNVWIKPKEATRAYWGQTTSPSTIETKIYQNPSRITRPTQWTINNKIIMISTLSLGQTSIGAIEFLHLHCEEFSCLLVSQALPQSIPRSLGPKSRPALQALPYIPNPGLLGPKKSKQPLGFTIYLAIHQQGFLGPLRQHILGLATTHSLAHGSLG